LDKTTFVLIKGYIEKAKEKLRTAEKLFAEGYYDDAVSRAYYSAFHITQALLLTEGLTADSHHGLVILFGLHFIKTGKIAKKFARYLSNLKDDREVSDYEVFSTIDKKTAEKSITEAKEFVEHIITHLQSFLKKR